MAKKQEREPGSASQLKDAIRGAGPEDYPMEPAPAPSTGQLVAGHSGRLYPTVDTPLSQCPTNLDLTTRHGKAMMLAAGNPGDIEFANGVAEIIATNYLIFPDEGVDPESGEVSIFARTVLFTADGRTFRTTSAHAPHRIAAACDLFTPEEWAGGITFVIRERMSSKTKHVYHDIRIME